MEEEGTPASAGTDLCRPRKSRLESRDPGMKTHVSGETLDCSWTRSSPGRHTHQSRSGLIASGMRATHPSAVPAAMRSICMRLKFLSSLPPSRCPMLLATAYRTYVFQKHGPRLRPSLLRGLRPLTVPNILRAHRLFPKSPSHSRSTRHGTTHWASRLVLAA
jgi:hypothetical protein